VSPHSGALEAVDRILNRGGDREDVLREVVAALHTRLFGWVALVTTEGELRAEAGERPVVPSLRAPVSWQGTPLGELQAEPREPDDGDRPLLERVALVISAYAR
jgi:hypothetical protein